MLFASPAVTVELARKTKKSKQQIVYCFKVQKIVLTRDLTTRPADRDRSEFVWDRRPVIPSQAKKVVKNWAVIVFQ